MIWSMSVTATDITVMFAGASIGGTASEQNRRLSRSGPSPGSDLDTIRANVTYFEPAHETADGSEAAEAHSEG